MFYLVFYVKIPSVPNKETVKKNHCLKIKKKKKPPLTSDTCMKSWKLDRSWYCLFLNFPKVEDVHDFDDWVTNAFTIRVVSSVCFQQN